MQLTKRTTLLINEKGYLIFSTTKKPIHRYNAEKKIGRKLAPGEVVHHINRNKLDNRYCNLWVFESQAQHNWIHKLDSLKFGRKISYQGF